MRTTAVLSIFATSPRSTISGRSAVAVAVTQPASRRAFAEKCECTPTEITVGPVPGLSTDKKKDATIRCPVGVPKVRSRARAIDGFRFCILSPFGRVGAGNLESLPACDAAARPKRAKLHE